MHARNPTLLLIRGLLREQRHWGEFIPTLQQQFPNARILTFDIPGNGALYLSKSPFSISDMTEALRQELFANGHAGPIHLLALSMGGMVALDWMTRYPHEIHAGVIINASLNGFSPFYHRLRWQNYVSLLQAILYTSANREACILSLTSNFENHNLALLKHWQQWQQQYPVSFQNAVRQLIASARFQVRQKPSPPLLVVTAAADQLVDHHCSLNIQQAWQTDLAVHPTAGHDLPLDAPHWLAETIERWLDTV